MSNALAIAAATAVLKDRLNDGLVNGNVGAIGSFDVTALPPDRFGPGGADEAPANRLNLFVYRVSPNTGWVNERLPARSRAGARLANPYLALDLHYMLSAYGSDELNDLVMLGYGMQVLHETPVLGREAVGQILGALPPSLQHLAASDLAEQVEQIRISPYYPDLEATSQVWSSLNTSLRPTALYVATVVLIESRASTRAVLPVLTPHLYVPLLRRPTIHRLLVEGEPGAPPVPAEAAGVAHGQRLILQGTGLAGEVTRVRLGEVVVDESDLEIGSRRLAFDLPAAVLPGIRGVQVVHEVAKEGGGTLPGETSSLKALVVSPSFVPGPDPAPIELTKAALTEPGQLAGPVDATVVLRLAHDVGRRQRATLLLNEVGSGAGGHAYAFDAEPLPSGADTADTLEIAIRGVAQGTYLVRVRIDGAESQLTRTDGVYSGPTLEVTP